jgi:hypothetical protein
MSLISSKRTVKHARSNPTCPNKEGRSNRMKISHVRERRVCNSVRCVQACRHVRFLNPWRRQSRVAVVRIQLEQGAA